MTEPDWLDEIEKRLQDPWSYIEGRDSATRNSIVRLVDEVKRLRVNALINTQQLKLPQIVQLQADRWDEGYTFGRLMQFDADNHEVAQTGPARNARKSLVANLDWARGRNRDNPYRVETP